MERDEGVHEFLARIKELGAQMDREDQERSRQLEEDILARRQARQKRRNERAQSLSPMKTDRGSQVLDGIDLSQLRSLDSNTPDLQREDALNETLEKLTGQSRLSKQDIEGLDLSPPALPRQRRSESPWQHRPDSRGTIASEHEDTLREGSKPASENEFRRSFITRNLGSRDVGDFKQNADRIVSTDTLLKSSDEGSSVATRKALPQVTTDSKNGFRPAPVASGKELPRRPVTSYMKSHKSTPSMNLGKQNLFPTTDAMRFEPGSARKNSTDEARQPAMSPSQGRIDHDRKPSSVNKGMETYAQNALLRREGSINKRWSATLPASRTGSGSPARGTISTERSTTPVSKSRDSSPAPSETPSTPEPTRKDMLYRGRAKSTVESLSKYSTSGIHPTRAESLKPEISPPTTPHSNPLSKTDQKRWSPTKTSWLEVAINKPPVLPKPAPVLEPQVKQPDSRSVVPKPVNLPPRSVMETASNITNTTAALNQVTSSPKTPSDKQPALDKPSPLFPVNKLPPPVTEKPSTIGAKPIPGPKAELDFRGNLKHRNSTSGSPGKEDLPFLDIKSKLRPTKSRKYVAPNVLKDNILAGKAALQETGPPKPKPPDPVKERLLSAKHALKQSNSTATGFPTIGSEAVSSLKPPLMKQASAPSRIEKGSLPPRVETLADKRLPNLGSMLSRGPPVFDKSRNFSGATTSSSGISSGLNEDSEKEGPGSDAPLTHMTKTRARGPKRRQPTKVQSLNDERILTPSLALTKPLTPKPSTEELQAPAGVPSLSDLRVLPVIPMPETLESAEIFTTESMGSQVSGVEFNCQIPSNGSERIKIEPPTPAKSPLLSAKTDFKSSPNTTPIPSPSLETSENIFSLDSHNEDFPKSIVATVSDDPPFVERPIQPPAMGWLARRTSSARASGPQRASFKPPQLEKVEEPTNTQAKSILRLPTVEDEVDISTVRPRPPLPTPPISNMELRNSLAPESVVRKISYGSIPKHVEELNSFFKDPEAANIKYDIDMSSFLPFSFPMQDKFETVKLDVWKVTAEGKVQSVDSGKEHILFDENIYMCLHTFGRASGENDAEFYLWTGSQVPPAAVADAQIFANKMASEYDASMTIIKQGHETPEFLNALGGIVITRKGNSESTYTSPYILCGRSLYDGIAFDEEDFKNPNFCSGFPFLINSNQTVYLWKGSGSTPKELAYARKVANDLAAGDIEDVEEGNEPQELLDIIQDGLDEKAAAKYWDMKPTYDNYLARLFKCDTKSPQTVTEISPFCQSDIEISNIYILDAFFEMYIVLGANSQSKRAEFQAALQFTEEYSKAAHTIDNRPFIPPTFVLLGGVSREFKAAFRSWHPNHIPTTWASSKKLNLRVVSLNDAMKAMNMTE